MAQENSMIFKKKLIYDFLKNLALNILRNAKLKIAGKRGFAAYWMSHMVPNDKWNSAIDSLDHFSWRNSQYQ